MVHGNYRIQGLDIQCNFAEMFHECPKWFSLILSDIDQSYWCQMIRPAGCKLCSKLSYQHIKGVHRIGRETSEPVEGLTLQVGNT